MAKIFGGSASRLEVYALFVAAVVLIGGSIGGAIVVTSGDEGSAPVTVVETTTTAVTSTVVASEQASLPVVTSSIPEQNQNSTPRGPSISVPGLTSEQADWLAAEFQRKQDADRAAEAAAIYKSTHPVGRVRDFIYAMCGKNDENPAGYFWAMMRWDYFGTLPLPYGVQVRVTATGHPRAGGGVGTPASGGWQRFWLQTIVAPAVVSPLTYQIETNGPEGGISGTVSPTELSCEEFRNYMS
jgi:hypothetical protein